jgi:hypothetical protein
MKSIYGIFLILLINSFSAIAQQNPQVPLSGEDSVRNLIESLPEVKEKAHVYDSLTNRVQNIIIKITPPDTVVKTYHVEAGYQGNNRFQPHFYFTVDLVNNIIYIEDWERGDRTTLEEWRARRSAAKGQK